MGFRDIEVYEYFSHEATMGTQPISVATRICNSAQTPTYLVLNIDCGGTRMVVTISQAIGSLADARRTHAQRQTMGDAFE